MAAHVDDTNSGKGLVAAATMIGRLIPIARPIRRVVKMVVLGYGYSVVQKD